MKKTKLEIERPLFNGFMISLEVVVKEDKGRYETDKSILRV